MTQHWKRPAHLDKRPVKVLPTANEHFKDLYGKIGYITAGRIKDGHILLFIPTSSSKGFLIDLAPGEYEFQDPSTYSHAHYLGGEISAD